jgi:hypothetical protein
MTTGYWDVVPKGIWSIVDSVDALEALKDKESRWALDKSKNRVNIYGTPGKAVTIDLNAIKENLSTKDYRDFIHELKSVVGGLI